MRLNRTSLLAGVALAALAAGVVPLGSRGGPIGFGFGPAAAQAQNLGQRVVSGYVVDANSKPVGGATVFLRDLKTKSIRSYTSAADGKFRFTQVNMAEDHELWAEKDGKKSATKTVSSWDTRTDFVCELKLK
ncbi:MAG: carboxypeptidase-like regulatory domain-containing protein [Terracidiphilus sp.]